MSDIKGSQNSFAEINTKIVRNNIQIVSRELLEERAVLKGNTINRKERNRCLDISCGIISDHINE